MAASHQWSKELPEDKSVCLQFHGDLEATLTASVDSYKHAEVCGKKGKVSTIQQRLGNAWNELGVYYMKATLVMDYAKSKLLDMWSCSICMFSVQMLNWWKNTGRTATRV